MDEWVNTGKDNSLTLENTNVINIKDGIALPISNILRNKYRSTITTNSMPAYIGSNYYYRPKRLSIKLYNNIELWHMLLWLNNMTTVGEFTKNKIRIFNPQKIELINEIIEHERPWLLTNRTNPVEAISDQKIYRRE